MKGIFSTHATINKHVGVAKSCCCRLLKCNYNFCTQASLGEVQCSAVQCKFLQLTEGWDIQLWYKPATIWRKSSIFCFVIIWTLSLKLRKTITTHNKVGLFEDKRRNFKSQMIECKTFYFCSLWRMGATEEMKMKKDGWCQSGRISSSGLVATSERIHNRADRFNAAAPSRIHIHTGHRSFKQRFASKWATKHHT